MSKICTKRIHGNDKKNLPGDFKKCPGSLHFTLLIFRFELQNEWTPPQIFFCGYRVFFIFCLNVEGAHDIKCSLKQLELKFCLFQRLDSNFTRCSPRRCSAIFIGKHLCQCLPLRSNFI